MPTGGHVSICLLEVEMTIEVNCPNGHHLKVKDKYAGKRGLCPHCKARVKVPLMLTDADALELVGQWEAPQPAAQREYVPAEVPSEEDDSASVLDNDPRPNRWGESDLSLLGSSIIRHEKACSNCGHLVALQYASCPKCNQYF